MLSGRCLGKQHMTARPRLGETGSTEETDSRQEWAGSPGVCGDPLGQDCHPLRTSLCPALRSEDTTMFAWFFLEHTELEASAPGTFSFHGPPWASGARGSLGQPGSSAGPGRTGGKSVSAGPGHRGHHDKAPQGGWDNPLLLSQGRPARAGGKEPARAGVGDAPFLPAPSPAPPPRCRPRGLSLRRVRKSARSGLDDAAQGRAGWRETTPGGCHPSST